jgi:hypothetical protein
MLNYVSYLSMQVTSLRLTKYFSKVLKTRRFDRIFVEKTKAASISKTNAVAMPKSFSSMSVNFIEKCKNILSTRIKISRLRANHLTNCMPWYASVLEVIWLTVSICVFKCTDIGQYKAYIIMSRYHDANYKSAISNCIRRYQPALLLKAVS